MGMRGSGARWGAQARVWGAAIPTPSSTGACWAQPWLPTRSPDMVRQGPSDPRPSAAVLLTV